jgi:hypothetical protein
VDGPSTTPSGARVLIVANPGESPELASALAEPLPVGPVDVTTGDGGDETLRAFAERRPEVVVVAASLEAGDARALIAAMREAVQQIHVILVGDLRGPIRNALDATDFGVDRFVGRPLSPKALRFAVGSGVGAVRTGFGNGPGEGSRPRRNAMIAPKVIAPESSGPTNGAGMPAVTAPMPAVEVPAPGALRARWEALADALELDDEPDASIPPPPVTILPRRAATDPGTAAARDEWTAAPPIVREPTVILPEPAVAEEPPPPVAPAAVPTAATFLDDEDDDVPVPTPGEIDLTERNADGHWAAAPSVRPVGDDDSREDSRDEPAVAPHDDLEDLSVDGPPADLGELSGEHRLPPPPSGTGFARELREKMSVMAQRLFQRGVAPSPAAEAPPAIGPSHDHRAEIDLAALAPAPHDFDAGGTFAGDRDESAVPTQTGLARERSGPDDQTGETGPIARAGSDAAALIARLAGAQFTGRLVLRRGDVEKRIFFDGGRPVFASSNEDGDRMGQLLVREGKITDEQFARCDAAVRETGRRMGEILVDRGYLKRRELLPAVRRHVEDILYGTFAWDQGEYRIIAGDGAESERIRLSRDPAAMVLEGVRRKLDRATLERLVGPPTTIVEIADREKLAAVIAAADLATDERAAVAGLDARSDLAHVARHSGALLDAVYALAWSLILLGVATAHRGAGDPTVDDDAPGMVGEADLAIDRERVHARARLVAEADYFALLGVRRGATRFEIRRAYEAARKDFAADGFPSELRRELAAELADIAQVLDEAYRVLRDDRLRSDYLAHLVD